MALPTAELERRLRPGGWFVEPLLAADESLVARIAQDGERLRSLGLDATQLGTALGELLQSAAGTDWFMPARVGPYRVEVRRRRGVATCPWAPEEHERCAAGDGGRGAGLNQFRIRDADSGRALDGFVLLAHLIREHGFFGGLQSAFRIEPESLAALLGQRVPPPR